MSSQEHLKSKLPQAVLQLPSECPLKPDSKRPRMTAEQVATTIYCLLHDDGPRNLKLRSTTGLKGSPGEEWVEADAQWETGYYRWAFFVRGGFVTNCFMCVSPKGSEFCINQQDAGNPFIDVSIEDQRALTHLLLNSQKKDLGISVVPCWIISINGAKPYAASLFYSEEEAIKAAEEQREHYMKYNKTLDSQIRDEKKANKEAMKAATVAFKPKKKGLKK